MRYRRCFPVMVVGLALLLSMALDIVIGTGGRPQLRLIRGASDEDRPRPTTALPLTPTRQPRASAPLVTATVQPTVTRLPLPTITLAPTITRLPLPTITPRPRRRPAPSNMLYNRVICWARSPGALAPASRQS